MGAARVTLMVFSMASILVLAGFSTILNEKAYAGVSPPFGDFKCWEIPPGSASPVPPARLEITDQFNIEFPIVNDSWEQIAYCTATEKNGELSPFSPLLDQHYQNWLYPFGVQNAGTGTDVIITVPQFNNQQFQTTLLELDSILVPATKTIGTGPVASVDFEQHWNCYNIIGPIPDVLPVDLRTQHGFQVAQVLDPFLFCAPMVKFDPFSQLSFGLLFEQHMVCYDLNIVSDTLIIPLPFLMEDQLTPEPITITFGPESEEVLCVPAFKSFPTVIGGSMVPIDTTALLLAGVQSISMWMIPVVVAGVGIGIFVIIRRK